MAAVEILQSDYKLKIDYLTAHLGRMWTRFGFFLTIESALFSYSLARDNSLYVELLCAFGVLISFLWYYFASTDNFLVAVYRRQVAHVFFLLKTSRDAAFSAAGVVDVPACYSYVGSISDEGFDSRTGSVEKIENGFWQRRSERVSATELGVVIAVAFILLWLARLAIWLLRQTT